jgi:uncharacterized membrane protein (DUF485 family)
MKSNLSVTETSAFKKLVKNRWAFSIIMTILIMFVYFGFILVIAFNKKLLSSKISSKLTLGIPVGIGIILFAWILTGIYVYWANKYYDQAVEEIKKDFLKKI